MTERESDLTQIASVLGANRMRYGWPPDPLSPGVRIGPRRHQNRDPKTMEPTTIEVFLVPSIEDSRLYYWNLRQRYERAEDAATCPTCHGATVIGHGGLVPGQYGFGLYRTCPRWNADTKRCDAEPRVDHMGIAV